MLEIISLSQSKVRNVTADPPSVIDLMISSFLRVCSSPVQTASTERIDGFVKAIDWLKGQE